MEELKLEMKPLDVRSGPCSMEVLTIYFYHSCLKCELIYSNSNRCLQELMVDFVTNHDRYYNILPGSDKSMVKYRAVISLMWR